MWSWIKSLFQKEETQVDDEQDDVIYACPKCGSTQIGYFTGLVNYSDVVIRGKHPKYGQSARCTICGFKTKVYLEDDNNTCLCELVEVKKDTNV
jgi:predicted RNA-binding Zn-ribbon protein involved in translation (DUF1610 family)